MGVGVIHRPHAIAFPGPAYITQFTDCRPNNNYQEFLERSASESAPQHTGAIAAAPELAFDSRQLKGVLDLCTDSGVARSFSTGTVSVYYRKGTNRGLRVGVAETEHDRWDMANTACLYWNVVSADQRSLAQIEAMIKAVSTDGATAPMVHVGSTALVGTSAVDSVYTLGPVSVNGSWLDGVVSSRIENGFTFDAEDESGNQYQQYFGIDEWNPRVIVDTNDLDVVNSFGESGTALTALKLYYRKLNKGSLGPVADGTAGHIKFSATSGSIFVQEGSGLKARFRVSIALSKPDASTAPFTLDTASAIAV